MRLFIIALLALALGACGELEKKDDIPGSELPPLATFQVSQLSTVAGSMGDLINYTGVQDGSLNSSSLATNNGSRKPARQKLSGSIDLSVCQPKTNTLKDIEYFSLAGVGCALNLKTEKKRIEDGNSGGDYKLSLTYSLDYSSINNLVNTDIQKMNMKKFEETTITNADIYLLKRKLETTTQAQSASLGTFAYSVKTRLERSVDFSTSTKNAERYLRTDSFEFSRFKAVLHVSYLYEDAKVIDNLFYLNGDEISENEYENILQDLNNEMGIKGKASLPNGFFDPFSS